MKEKNNKTDVLFQLIHSLSASEKRYFKINSTQFKQEKDNIYVKIFDFLDSSETYEHTVFLDYVESLKANTKMKIANISSLKAYLQQRILESLVAFSTKKNFRLQLSNTMQEINILKKKGLYELALQKLNKIDKQAQELGYINTFNLVLEKRVDLYSIVGNMDFLDKNLPDFLALLAEMSECVNLKNKFMAAYTLITYHLVNFNEATDEAVSKQQLENLIFCDAEQQQLVLKYHELYRIQTYLKYRFYQIYARADKMIIKLLNKEALDKYEQSSSFLLKCNYANYIGAYNSFLWSCILVQDFDDFFAHLMDFRNINKKHKKIISDYNVAYLNYQSECKSYYLEVLARLLLHDYEKLIELEDVLLNQLKKHRKYLHIQLAASVKAGLCIAHFFVANYDNAIEQIQALRQDTDLQMGVKKISMYIEMLVHYKLENEKLLNALIKNYKRYLKAHDVYDAYAETFFDMLQKLTGKRFANRKKAVYEQAFLDFSRHQSKQDIVSFNIALWIEKEISIS